MNNKLFLKNVENLFDGDNVMLLIDSCGRNIIIEREEGERLYYVGLYIVLPRKNAYKNKRFITAFNIKAFIDECDRLHLNYLDMLTTMINDLIKELLQYGSIVGNYKKDIKR